MRIRELSAEFLGAVLATAFDEHAGACWRWASPGVPMCESFGPMTWRNENGGVWRSVMLRTEEGEGLLVTHRTVEAGIRRLLDGEVREYAPDSDVVRHLQSAFSHQDGAAIDADAADLVVQAGLFGRVVYP